MSDNYQQQLKKLGEHYDLTALEAMQLKHLDHCIDQGRQEFRRKLDRAKRKGGFSNTKVARLLKSDLIFELVERAGAEFVLAMVQDQGEHIANHRRMLSHFAQAWAALEEIQGDEEDLDSKDPTRLVHLSQWVFIGLNTMLDAAAMPKSNDYQIKRSRSERRRFDEEDDLPSRPSVQTIQQRIGEVILFQTKMAFYQRLFPYWFKRTYGEAVKDGAAGLRYFSRDMDHNMSSLLASMTLAHGKWQAGSDLRFERKQSREERLRVPNLSKYERDYLLKEAQQDQAEDAKAAERLNQIALLNGLQQFPDMENSAPFKVILGSWIYGIVFDGTELFVEAQEDIKSPKKLDLREECHELREAFDHSLKSVSLSRPMLSPPLELTNRSIGGRLYSKEKPLLTTPKGQFEFSQERLDFFNRQALVPFRINRFVFDVLTTLKERNVDLGNFDHYMAEELPMPSDLVSGKPKDWDRLSESEQYVWLKANPQFKSAKQTVAKLREKQIKRLRLSLPSKEIYRIAAEAVSLEQFWIPVFPEFRGRLMADVSNLNYQGRDAAKALIKLALPVEVNDGNRERTRFWIANHLASCFGGTLDKKPFSQRINFVEDPVFQEKIRAVATMVSGDFSQGLQVLKEVDDNDGKPLMFAAACREWFELFVARSKSTTDLMVGVDATCSGQQFAAAWRRSKTLAKAVNLIPADEPSDLYGLVYANLHDRIKGSLSERHERALRLNGHGRSIAKGGIQPMQYGSSDKTGTAGLRKKMEKLAKGPLKLHEREQEAIVKHFHKALCEVSEMTTTNEWYRSFAAHCGAIEGKTSIVIPTALGDSIEMQYQQSDSYVIDTFRYGSLRYKRKGTGRKQITLVEPNGKPDTEKWVTGLNANTTHGAGDATLLAIALHDCPYDFGTNHDAVYAAAPNMDNLGVRLRKAFVRVGSFDLFSEIQKANGVDLKPGTVPNPVVGDWKDLDCCLDSLYMFN